MFFYPHPSTSSAHYQPLVPWGPKVMKMEFSCRQEGESSRWLCDKAESQGYGCICVLRAPERGGTARCFLGPGTWNIAMQIGSVQALISFTNCQPRKNSPGMPGRSLDEQPPNPTSFIWRHRADELCTAVTPGGSNVQWPYIPAVLCCSRK